MDMRRTVNSSLLKSISGRHNVELFYLIAFPRQEKILFCLEFVPRLLKEIGYDVELEYLQAAKTTQRRHGEFWKKKKNKKNRNFSMVGDKVITQASK